MIPFEKAVVTLEYDKVLRDLASLCAVEAGKEKILSLRPETDPDRVLLLQKQTSSARRIAGIRGEPSLSAHPTLPDVVDRAEKGALLNGTELLRVAQLLHSADRAKSYGEGLEGEDAVLGDIFRRLLPDRSLAREIDRALPSEDTVADDASPALFDIRRKKNTCALKIRETLQHYISGAYSAYLQENIITFRNARYVIPVKSEFKNEIHGLIHDTSSSGATVFIEPMSVVELNNRIKELDGEERAEIERIMWDLSGKTAADADILRLNFINVVELSIIFARAELGARQDAVTPVISAKGVLDLVQAKHPLLDPKKAVPISVSLGRDFDTLVITGPNTGGKTVTLKTMGLLAMMAQSGLQIPAREAIVPVYPDILADIGDEQSIEQSLSTFSAHIMNIIDMLSRAKSGVLMLFDELGSGTDPVEGAALAEAILATARERGAKCAATTHYAELKTYALETPGVENASCEFDISTLMPTYRLILGAPGRSNAFLIAARLGLDEEIIQRANVLVKAEDRRFESVVGKLEDERVSMEKKHAEAQRLFAEAKKMRDEAMSEREGLLASAEKESERAKREALRLIRSARAVSDQTFAKLEEMRKKAEKEKNLEWISEERQKMRQSLGRVEDKAQSGGVDRSSEDDSYVLPRPLRVGDAVFLPHVGKEGVVEKIRGNDVSVQVGNLRMKTPLSGLRLITELRRKKTVARGSATASPRSATSSSVDVRGMITDDAWAVVDKYLDSAVLTGYESVTVIHGKGTGALKKGLWSYFKGDPRIASFRLGNFGEGDAGVTVITLK
ncbi:MAG: endonuclease MutS2 [Clostridia bacterium]|nr:endonuclease MutS2 [Clostridia bacterium]